MRDNRCDPAPGTFADMTVSNSGLEFLEESNITEPIENTEVSELPAQRDPSVCGSDGKTSCPGATCCRTPKGWACFQVALGVCCSDGLSACPINTKCNLKEKRCDPAFSAIIAKSTDPAIKLEDSAAIDFFEGFNDGFSFFKGLPHETECNPEDPQIVQDIVDIANILKNLTIHSDFKQVIADITAKATDAYNRLSTATEGCKAYAQEVQRVGTALQAFVKQDGYSTKVAYHSLTNIGQITSKVQAASTDITSQNYNKAGFDFGDLLKFVVFWDVKA